MNAPFQYYAYLREPTLDVMRIDHSPRDGTILNHDCFYALLSGESGAFYNIMRALPAPSHKDMSMNFGAYRGNEDLNAAGTLVFPFREHPALESFRQIHSNDSVIYAGDTFRFEVDTHEFHWTDANGRIDVHATRLGQMHELYVPTQEGFPGPIVWQDHMAKMTGTIDGDPVEGIFHDSHIYGRPEFTFHDMAFTTRLENYWLDWLVEYDDGTLEGGWAMQGHREAPYTVAHHVVDGVSTTRSDARMSISRNEQGNMQQATLRHGRDLEIVLDQHGSFDRPIHTYGTVSSISHPDKTVAKSWNYTENWPRNWGAVERYQMASADLYGRFPSLKGILEPSRWENEYLVFD
ncbi:MAG: hypothetical protein QOF01_3639 [Thermomicrobiales bacterium]|jgi:hypothetical protein|nr:hypothetical protein [Thermomicrobiales bacterium]